MTTAAEVLAATSRTEGTMRRLALAVERIRDVEAKADAAFAEIVGAQEEASEVGVEVDVVMNPGMAAAFAAWKQARVHDESSAIAREELGLKAVDG